MTKRFVPPIKSGITLAPGHAAAGEFRRVPVADVHVLENLNLRVRGTPEYDQAVNEFAASIEANGFYDDKPLAGYLDADGKVIVVDGHRRLEAVQRLNSASLDGDVVADVPVVLKPEDSTLSDLTIAMIQSSSGRELTMFEKGIGVRRLMADGMDKADIARRLGVTEKSIDNYIAVASVPAKARDLLLDDKVTSTQVLRAKGDVTKLQAMVDRASAKGRARARPSDATETASAAPSPSSDALLGSAPETSQEDVAAEFAQNPLPVLTDDPLTFTVDVLKDQDLGPVLRQLATEIRARVPHDQGDDTDAAHVNGTITVSVVVAAVEKPKRTRKSAKTAPVPDELSHAIPDEL